MEHTEVNAGARRTAWLFLALTLAAILARAVYFHAPGLGWVAEADNDDILRLLSVRGWLAGQGWFDMHQYRMMPPDGVDMHWSRYVDAGIAGAIWLAQRILPGPAGEGLALALWPVFLMLPLAVMTWAAARRLFGDRTSVLTLLSLLLWPVFGQGYFAPYRIDHHNAQILLQTLMVLSLILARRPVMAGITGGIAAALSLAIGLEGLPLVGLAGVILLLRVVWMAEGAAAQLAAFALSLLVASSAFFLGQTAPLNWAAVRCDQLSAPVLTLAAIAAAISCGVAWSARRLPGPLARLALAAVLSAAGTALLAALFKDCLSGPYGALPDTVREMLLARVTEAQGAIETLAQGPGPMLTLILPALFACLLAGARFAVRMRSGIATQPERQALPVLLAVALTGLVGSLDQLRMILLSAGAVPLLTGYGLAGVLYGGLPSPATRFRGPVALAAMTATLFLPGLMSLWPSGPARAEGPVAAPSAAGDCRAAESYAGLSRLPEGVVLTGINLSARVLLTTPHGVLSGPYHRSPEAIANGFLPFEGDEAEARATMERYGARYLVFCAGETDGDGASFTDALMAGQTVDWLVPVPDAGPVLRVFKRRGG